MNKSGVVRALGALAHPIRLDVFRALVVAGHEGLTPGVLIEQLDVPSAKLSFHLKELAIAGLVTQERSSRNVIYRAAYDQMDGVIRYLADNCCKGFVPAPQDSDAAACAC
jgi:ArsR family transcriptional regulator, arsenate/arsenite/antimonite-responsive transcriptional repressor